MKSNFKLVKRMDPKTKAHKWYAIPVQKGTMTEDDVAEVSTRNTTIARHELKGSLEVLSESVPGMLLSGNSVRIGKMGTLRLSFGSEGVENIDDFDTSMIRNMKIIFTPSKELKEALQNPTFENAGVVEAGFTFASMKAYKEFQVSARPEGSKPGGSGSGGDGGIEDDPLG